MNISERLSEYTGQSEQVAAIAGGAFADKTVLGGRVRAAFFRHVFTASTGATGAKVALAILPTKLRILRIDYTVPGPAGLSSAVSLLFGSSEVNQAQVSMVSSGSFSITPDGADGFGLHTNDQGFDVFGLEVLSTVNTTASIYGVVFYTEES